MPTVWDTIQPIAIRRASNGVVLVSDDKVTWGTQNAAALDKAVAWAQETPASEGVGSVGRDYEAFCKRVSGKIPSGRGAKREQTVQLFNSALAEFDLDDLGAALGKTKDDEGKPGSKQ